MGKRYDEEQAMFRKLEDELNQVAASGGGATERRIKITKRYRTQLRQRAQRAGKTVAAILQEERVTLFNLARKVATHPLLEEGHYLMAVAMDKPELNS